MVSDPRLVNGATGPAHPSYVDWCTILAGAAVAVAFSILFLQFGSGVGFADMTRFRDDVADVTPARLLVAGVYILLIQVLASIGGGYVAGRLRMPVPGATEHEKEVRDGLHGLLVWATGTLVVFAGTSLMAAFASFAVEPNAEVQRAQDIVDQETVIAVILAFGTGASSLVSAVAAWVAAVKGGDHRDRGVDYSRQISFLK